MRHPDRQRGRPAGAGQQRLLADTARGLGVPSCSIKPSSDF